MKKIPLLIVLLFVQHHISAQMFTAHESEFTGIFYGDCHWANINNDSRPDVIISGAEPEFTGYAAIYQNDAEGFTKLTNPTFPNIMYSAIETADFDGNGHQDIIITGTKTSATSTSVFLIYYNNGDGTFNEISDSGITPVNFGSVQAVDFNNDGLVDILVNGQTTEFYVTKIYAQESDGDFIEQSSALIGTYFSDTKVFDANMDGLPDLLVTGFNTSFTPDTKLYLNQGDFTFAENNSNLIGAYFSSIDTADINNDGFPDLLITGMSPAFAASTTVYLNDGQANFTVLETEIPGAYSGSARWIDYDSDGLKDIFIIGSDTVGANIAKFYKNNGDLTFTEDTETSNAITGLNMSKAEFADYDNDGDLDLLTVGFDGDLGITKLYTNNSAVPCSDPGNTPGDLGCVTFTYQNETKTYVTVRAKDGNIWLQQNLGSDNIAAFETDDNAFGDLFQWGRWDDGHQKRNATISAVTPQPNNPTGLNGAGSFLTSAPEWWATGAITDTWEAAFPENVTATNGCDPCKALGNDWSVPTQQQWTEIIAQETITNIATAYESNLKLPVAGSRLPSGNFNFTGVRGYYWSKTPSDNVEYVKYLYYSNFIVNPNAGSSRAQALSVRCIKTPTLEIGSFNKSEISIYPNPTSGIVNIDTKLAIDKVNVYNITGQLIQSTKSTTIDLSGAKTGIYVVKIEFENGQSSVHKVIRR